MLRDMAPEPRAGGIDRARASRRGLTLPEGLLWRELRKRPGGLKFRRQHPSGPFVLDFYCGDARLAVEIDGSAHGMGDRPAHDEGRDAWFARAGIATLRIPAKLVLGDLPGALRWIEAEAIARLPLHHPAAPGGPPPRAKLGEE